jgi:hypothetical protein
MKNYQPLLLAAMMTCLIVPCVVVGEMLLTGWRGAYVLVVVPLTVIEGIWSQRIYHRERLSGVSQAWRFLAEGVILLLILKLFSYLGHGFRPFLEDLVGWIHDPSTFLTLDFVLLTPLVIGVWSISRKLETDLQRLSDPLDTGVNRQSARGSIRSFVLWGGLWLLSISGALLGFAKDHFSLSQGNSLLIEGAVICYLGLSLLLLGYVQYLRKYMEWQIEGLSVPDVIAHRWLHWGILLVVCTFLIAALLPAASSYGPEQLIVTILNILLFLAQLLMTLLTFLFSPFIWAISLLGGQETPTEIPPVELPEVPTPSIDHIPLWWISLRHVLQYIMILTFLVLVFITYSRNRELKLPRFSEILLFFKQGLQYIWLWIKGFFSGAYASLRTFGGIRRLTGEVDQIQAAKKWSLYHASTHRAQVRRYYFSLLRRASEAGFLRHPQQTPKEFEAELISKLPEQYHELTILTDAFIHARYDARDIHQEDVRLARKAWYTLRKRLRHASI